MSNAFDEMRLKVSEAQMQLRAADECATDMAYVLRGRLHHVKDRTTLSALKRELAAFDLRTLAWKDRR